MDIARAYDLIAEGWANEKSDLGDWGRDALKAFTDGLPKGAEILDVGCGPGRFAAALDDIGFRVMGIDVSGKMIDLARAKAPKGEFRVMDMRDATSLGRTFDGIFACASLLHVPRNEVPGVLRRLAGICRPGGRIYLAIMEPLADEPLERMLKENRYGQPVERFYSHFRPEEIVSWLASIGHRPVWERRTSLGGRPWYEIVASSP